MEFELSEIPQHLRKYFTPKHKRWIVRNDCIWAKRNGMPESVTDRFSKKHEYMFFMVKSEKYYFDLDAIRDKSKDPQDDLRRITQLYNKKYKAGESVNGMNNNNENDKILSNLLKGKNPGSVSDFWDIPTKPSNEKHYAVYNDGLLVKPILAGCPKGGIIYDPFMGTGSTAEAALRAGRLFVGSEMSSEYNKIANKRLEPLLLQGELF